MHETIDVKARDSVAPFHRLKYFNHKIIFASIERLSDDICARRDRVAERTGRERLTLLHRRIQLSRLHAPPQTFSAGRETGILTF
ncbi:hypothetical protein [Bradyrhizobium sp. LMTR 3]|uniref:hypothetical protein n=1 Tax=Bradyrhizobium sp. LMTR 3 TaxID=189873 RepID=UPI0011470178|nr:hypothetical protein [Bradyrhizobium sp. LMTR 3]